jgi:hypothetical protein
MGVASFMLLLFLPWVKDSEYELGRRWMGYRAPLKSVMKITAPVPSLGIEQQPAGHHCTYLRTTALLDIANKM